MESPSYKEVESAAWDAALSSLDKKGDPIEDFEHTFNKFIKRKPCKDIPEKDCNKILVASINVASHTIKFMRSKIGAQQPKTERQNELLLKLSQELMASCPDANESLHMLARGYIQMYWAR